MDTQEVKFGFRTIEFKKDGFYLNGQKTFLRGLNRHQCYPYIGYAAPESLQREDARILKEELGCVAVRTSHYPQSQYFIDECDRLGLLVFTEIPGWQHIGDDAWKEQACKNVEEMVLQYRNHPSIVLWGVRINESQDCDELYRRTNAIAHSLDPSRPTSGVRCIEKSHLLEDIYSFNDFSHAGNNHGVRPPERVAPTTSKAIVISEHSGHMFPTKSYDPWMKRQEHALRHARVLNDAMADGQHAGCFGWCMFDYPTHKDFGSGDRVCYHGVMDSFRNPKLAAAVYASQQDNTPVLAVGSPMDIGDYPGGQIGDVYAFTNATAVYLYKNGNLVDTLTDHSRGVVRVEDTVGGLLESQEGFSPKKAALLRKCLVAIGKKGLAGLSPADYLRMGYAMLRYKLKYEDAFALYGKYIGNWGGEATVWRFDAVEMGEVVASVTCCPSAELHLEVTASATTLEEKQSYDMAAVRIRVLDAFGNIAPYAQLPVKLHLEGAAELVGPDVVTAEGGMTGTYIRTTGRKGKATLTISTEQTEPVTVSFIVQ
jgi:beta-galactosidase